MIRMIVITAAVALVAAVARWLALRSRARVFWEDRCAACGYIVRGLPGHVCPECGADLRPPGSIIPAGVRAGLADTWLFFAWTATFGLVYAAVEGMWLSRADEVVIVDVSGTYDHPIVGDYDGFSVTYQGKTYRGKPVSGRIDLTLRLRGGNTARMVVDPTTWSYHTTDGKIPLAGPSGFGSEVLAQWLTAYGVDPSAPKARAPLNGLERTLRDWSVGRAWSGPTGFPSSLVNSATRPRPTHAVQAVRIGSAVTWIVIAAWLVLRSRHALSSPSGLP
jgi:hypothetical protein